MKETQTGESIWHQLSDPLLCMDLLLRRTLAGSAHNICPERRLSHSGRQSVLLRHSTGFICITQPEPWPQGRLKSSSQTVMQLEVQLVWYSIWRYTTIKQQTTWFYIEKRSLLQTDVICSSMVFLWLLILMSVTDGSYVWLRGSLQLHFPRGESATATDQERGWAENFRK